jgi:hypothetical protein
MSDVATQITSTVNSATIENLSEQERSLPRTTDDPLRIDFAHSS